MPNTSEDPSNAGRGVGEVICDELKRLFPGIETPTPPPTIGLGEDRTTKQARWDEFERTTQSTIDNLPEPLSALCLSGGGIRSAAFALGALQALARCGALEHFHYLSTVSGGGYIGGWLTAWRHHAKSDAKVFAGLDQLRRTGQEAAEIAGIRADSNYLTPRLGLLSPDTWAVVALTVRNLVLNWLVFGPLFLGLLFIPLFSDALLVSLRAKYCPAPHCLQPPPLGVLFAWIGAAFALFASIVAFVGRLRMTNKWLTTGRFIRLALIPATIASACFTLAAAVGVNAGPGSGVIDWRWILGGAALYVVAWMAARLIVFFHQKTTAGCAALELVAAALTGAVVGAILLVGVDFATLVDSKGLVVFGVLWTLMSILVGDIVYVAVSSFLPRSDMDREWLARASGLCMATAISWSIIAGIDLHGPWLLKWSLYSAWTLFGTVTITGAFGFITLIIGSSGKTAALPGQAKSGLLSLNNLVTVASVVFAICLVAVLSAIDAKLRDVLTDVFKVKNAPWMKLLPLNGAGLVELGTATILIAVAFGASCLVNINRFTLHGIYRNRLVRAFLGSARAGAGKPRSPDPFTSFDSDDNPRMFEVRPEPKDSARLLHVINMTLNVVSTKKLAWQERKAEVFTVTDMACGNPIVGYRRTEHYGGRHGLSLGTAMAVSGAAVSPNMGYHSSAIVSFLLMLFNVRLGWWLGNPARAQYRKKGPQPGLVPALMELAGATTDDRKWIYLSDGGHFENLGLYEMVRRRCRFIVVSDAGADAEGAFEDFGNAVRKIFIDQGVGIEFERFEIHPRQEPPAAGAYCAIGTITYPGSSKLGWLLYIKPGYHGDERLDIRSYAMAHRDFPHESTLDQWYSESQFEAYRALGAHVLETICNGGAIDLTKPIHKVSSLQELRLRANRYMERQTGMGG
jgi:Patatin-like phospholipase